MFVDDVECEGILEKIIRPWSSYVYTNEQQVNKMEITQDKQYIAAAGNPHVRFYEVNNNNANPVNENEKMIFFFISKRRSPYSFVSSSRLRVLMDTRATSQHLGFTKTGSGCTQALKMEPLRFGI